MPTHLLHVEANDLPAHGQECELLSAFRAYLPRALQETRGVAILAPDSDSTTAMLMVLARNIGAALRDDNIRMRAGGHDMRTERKSLAYLPGTMLATALADSEAYQTLTSVAACFIQDLALTWSDGSPDLPEIWLNLLTARLAASRPTFLSADPASLPASVREALRRGLTVIEQS
ncbi:MAG: hypothetical protein ACKVVP_11920 [Chloroflexota bacterium]